MHWDRHEGKFPPFGGKPSPPGRTRQEGLVRKEDPPPKVRLSSPPSTDRRNRTGDPAIHCNFTVKQESPPAWTQEAYHPPCSEYSFCCPTRVPPGGYPSPGTPPGGYWGPGTPPGGYPSPGTPPPPPRGGGYRGPGIPPGGVPKSGGVPGPRYPPGGVPGPRYPPGGGTRIHGILGNVAKHYGIWVPPPCGQTDW